MALIKKAKLVLATGAVFEGQAFGAENGSVIGEVVFTTGMTGYQETLTDPSYAGQIITQTFPLIGNYGVNSEDFESMSPAARGYIVREHCEYPSNFRSENAVDWFLKQHDIIGLANIDTRALTRVIRETGVMNGMILSGGEAEQPVSEELLTKIRAYKIGKIVPEVSVSEPVFYAGDGGFSKSQRRSVALVDYGCKNGIRAELQKRGCAVTILPWNVTAKDLVNMKPDGIMLSNGPGDPEDNAESIQTIRELMTVNIPVFGICLGHQLAALANGGRTVKLKYGHRGANQPVIDLVSKKTYVTSQNHGYAVVNDSIAPDIGEVSHVNANDKTCEGVRYRNAPVFTVQFHPEARGGPRDTQYLFDEFVKLMDSYKNMSS